VLAGCVHRPPGPPLELQAERFGNGCRFEAEGQVLASDDLEEAERLLAAAARAWRGRPATVLAGVDVPYKCFGLAIYALQRAGLPKVGFIAEPAPEAD
jgi:hypothetical protein